MEIRTTNETHGTTMAVAGEADADNCHELGEALDHDQITGGLHIDLSDLQFLDSSALSELLRIHKTLGERDVPVTITSASPAVHRVLEITGLLQIFGLG